MGTNHFVAREDELAKMHETLHREQGRRNMVVHGLGGMGKTQLAIAYMKRHRNEYTASIWLNARDETSLQQGFRNAAAKVLEEHPTFTYMQTALDQNNGDASHAVKRWLNERGNDKWLLICDNYDHPKMRADTSGILASRDSGPDQAGCKVEKSILEDYDIRRCLPDVDQGAVIITTRSSSVRIGDLLPLRKLHKMEDSLRILESTSARKGAQYGT